MVLSLEGAGDDGQVDAGSGLAEMGPEPAVAVGPVAEFCVGIAAGVGVEEGGRVVVGGDGELVVEVTAGVVEDRPRRCVVGGRGEGSPGKGSTRACREKLPPGLGTVGNTAVAGVKGRCTGMGRGDGRTIHQQGDAAGLRAGQPRDGPPRSIPTIAARYCSPSRLRIRYRGRMDPLQWLH